MNECTYKKLQNNLEKECFEKSTLTSALDLYLDLYEQGYDKITFMLFGGEESNIDYIYISDDEQNIFFEDNSIGSKIEFSTYLTATCYLLGNPNVDFYTELEIYYVIEAPSKKAIVKCHYDTALLSEN